MFLNYEPCDFVINPNNRQWGIGQIIQLWPSDGDRYDPVSYQVAIAILVLIQILVLFWYFISYKLESKDRFY